MPRKQTLIVALSLAFAAVVGTVALTKTVHLGQAAAAKPVSKSLIAKRTAQLDRFEASLRAELRKKPPAVPKVPSTPVARPVAPLRRPRRQRHRPLRPPSGSFMSGRRRS